MIPHEDKPEDLDPSEVDEVSESIKTLSARLTKILKHAHLDQGLLAIDLIEALHHVQGQVISWGMVEALEEDSEDGLDDDSDHDEGDAPTGDVSPQGWSPASDLPQEGDDGDVDDQGDPRLPV